MCLTAHCARLLIRSSYISSLSSRQVDQSEVAYGNNVRDRIITHMISWMHRKQMNMQEGKAILEC